MIGRHFIAEVIRPALAVLDPHIPYSEDAALLLLGTAIHESGDFQYLRQVRGPALGVFQIEPATLEDCYRNFLAARPGLEAAVEALRRDCPPEAALMIHHDYAAAIARVIYRRSPLPIVGTPEGLWGIYKTAYNSALGAAREDQVLPIFRQVMTV